jgi:hypothetical protein
MMAKQLGRWRSTDQYGAGDFIGATPRALAALRQITDSTPAKKAGPTHVHVHLPAGSAAPAHDQAPPRRPAMRPRDQEEEPEPGVLLCRLGQHGSTGEWSAETPDGKPLIVESGPRGLDIFSPAEVEGEQADGRPFGATEPPGAASLDQLRRRIGPRPAHDRLTSGQQQSAMAAYQSYLDEAYRPRS